MLSGQFIAFFVKYIEIIKKAVDWHHSLDSIVKFYKKSPGSYSGDNSCENSSDILLHIFYFFELIYFTLCVLRTAFHCRTLLCYRWKD